MSRWSKPLKQDTMTVMTLIKACFTLIAISVTGFQAHALPADFIGRYEILDSRQLSISGGAAYVIQDGQLVIEISRNRNRPYCRAMQSFFDESQGTVDVRFSSMADGTERAILKTIPALRGASPTTIECYSEQGFFGSLDLSIALGQIVSLGR